MLKGSFADMILERILESESQDFIELYSSFTPRVLVASFQMQQAASLKEKALKTYW